MIALPMAGWIGKLFGKTASTNSAVSNDHTKALRAIFSKLEKIDSDLPDQALRYVVAGEHEDVLARLAASADAAKLLGIKGAKAVGVGHPEPDAVLYGSTIEDPLVYVRLGRLYEAASRTSGVHHTLTWNGGAPIWLELLLWEASNQQPTTYSSKVELRLSHASIEQILAAAGEPADLVLRLLLSVDPMGPNIFAPRRVIEAIPGLAEAAQRHPTAVREALANPSARTRGYATEQLAKASCPVAPFVDAILPLALDSAKTVREPAETWLQQSPEDVVPAIKVAVDRGTPKQRSQAVTLLWRIAGTSARSFLEERRETADTAAVKKAIAAILEQSTPVATSTDERLPPVAVGPLPPLSPEVREALTQCAATWHTRVVQALTGFASRMKEKPQLPAVPSKSELDEWFALLQRRDVTVDGFASARLQIRRSGWLGYGGSAEFHALVQQPGMTLGHTIRLAGLLGLVSNETNVRDVLWGAISLFQEFQRASGQPFGLREIAAELAAIGVDTARLGRSFVLTYGRPRGWSNDQVWPYFVETPELLEQALGLKPLVAELGWMTDRRVRTNALEILAMMPRVPANFQMTLWDIALAGPKADRVPAQQCLDKLDGTGARVVAALLDSKQAVREVGADWLAARREVAAIQPLKTALKKEKNDRAKAAMMSALEALGVSVDEFLDRPGLLKEAQKLLAKGLPEALAWFPFDRLPTVHWSDDGKPVDPSILNMWLVQANKLGTPEPTPLFRRYAAQLTPTDARDLGRVVLDSWLAYDTALPTESEAAQRIQELMRWGMPAEQARQAAMSQPKGSAIAHKGLLGIAAATAQEAAAAPVARFLKDWYGMRSAQCKALLQMLSWVDHPSAIQVLLATATRFRTAGIREVAEECVREVADRRGWTVDELADRTIPTTGLDDSGVLELSYGPRTFRAHLNDELALVLENEDGKTISSLPEPRASDDEAVAKEAKQLFSRAKKDVKTVVKQQRDRLYEAMCTQRRWRFADWQTYLVAHPIMGRLSARVVWLVDGGARSFRPLGDGTLSGVDDSRVEVGPDERVGIAHPSALPPDAPTAWAQHLADYEVEVLFDQFGRKPYNLAESMREQDTLKDFEGHLLEAFKLRGRATKLGYVRGQAEDGGWFHVYLKHFPSLGVTAEVEFSGNSLPEENRTVALHALRFRSSAEEGMRDGLPLGEVPRVLVSECWNDMREMAADGSGFDPDWQSKVNI
jgi:hypothetical protein